MSPTRGGVKSLCTEFGVSESVPRRIWLRYCAEKSIKRKPTSGRPTKITPEVAQMILERARELKFDFTNAEMAEWAGLHASTVSRYLKKANWRLVKRKYRPLLTDNHKAARLAWAKTHERQEFMRWVDIDEKWFYTVPMTRSLKVPEGETPPRPKLQHKSHIPKLMMLVAVGRPDPQRGFNGMYGAWRVGDWERAKRNSKNRPKGTRIFVDKAMDSNRYLKMMKSQVIPAICKVYPDREVTIQYDNAPGHVSGQTTRTLQQHVTRQRPNIRLLPQPPQSPDLNVLDLAVFPSLSSRVGKAQRTCGAYDKQTLWENVKREARTLAGDVLTRAFDTKQRVIKAVIEDGGDNSFPIPRSK